MLDPVEEVMTPKMPTVWFTAVRRGSGASRAESKSLFYPVIIHRETGAFIRVGNPLSKDMPREEFHLEGHEQAIWPLGADGGENRWRFSADLMRRYFENGTARLGRRDPRTGTRPITYLQPGTLTNIENGTFVVTGRTAEGAVELALGRRAKAVAPRTVWNQTSHFARDHGSHVIGALLGGRKFPFPKALYAVEDTLRFFLADKPDAVVLDFFSGSGTTAHAVMRLNKQDGGMRQCISVTNNEVGADEQKSLRKKGLRPGDPEWEALGICDYVTKPRVTAAITGNTPAGDPIKDDYKFTDEFSMADGFEENAAFFTLTYEDPRFVGMHRAFARIAPILWMRAGSLGRIIDDLGESGWDVSEVYAVAHEPEDPTAFLEAVADAGGVSTVFIVTDSNAVFEATAQQLPDHVTPVRLYESYLHNFTINRGA